MPSSDDYVAIRALAETLRLAVNAADVAGILACWTPDGVLLPPHHPAVHGHAAMASYFRERFAARRLTFTFTASATVVAGDLAIERLTYTAVSAPANGRAATEDEGKGLHVYSRRPDGQWLLAQDIWNSDRP